MNHIVSHAFSYNSGDKQCLMSVNDSYENWDDQNWFDCMFCKYLFVIRINVN